jgi:hypothetical protein
MSLTNALVSSDMTSLNAPIDTNPTATGLDLQEPSNPSTTQRTMVTPMTHNEVDCDLYINIAVHFPLADNTIDILVTEVPFDDIFDGNKPTYCYMEHIDGAIISTIRGSRQLSAMDRQTLRHIVGTHDYIISILDIKHGAEFYRTIHSDKALKKFFTRKYREYVPQDHVDDSTSDIGLVTKIVITFPPNVIIGHHLLTTDAKSVHPQHLSLMANTQPNITPTSNMQRSRLQDHSRLSPVSREFFSTDPPCTTSQDLRAAKTPSQLPTETATLQGSVPMFYQRDSIDQEPTTTAHTPVPNQATANLSEPFQPDTLRMPPVPHQRDQIVGTTPSTPTAQTMHTVTHANISNVHKMISPTVPHETHDTHSPQYMFQGRRVTMNVPTEYHHPSIPVPPTTMALLKCKWKYHHSPYTSWTDTSHNITFTREPPATCQSEYHTSNPDGD